MIYQNTGPSGGKLGFLLNCSVRMPHSRQKFPAWEREAFRKGTIPIPINYGCHKKYIPEGCLNYNSEDVQDKIHCFKIFEKNGIPFPTIITNPGEYGREFLGRRNNSSQGRGIVKFQPKQEGWEQSKSDFYVEYIDVDREFRVHVVRGLPLCEFNKDFSQCSDFIHSNQFGSRLVFGALNHPKRKDIIDASLWAIHKCGLDYGAVDIISERGTNRWMVLEVNSAPSMAHEIGFLYAERFAHMMDISINKWWSITGTGQIIDNRRHLRIYNK